MTLDEDASAPTEIKPDAQISSRLEELAAQEKNAEETRTPLSLPKPPPVDLYAQWSRMPYEDIKDLNAGIIAQGEVTDKFPWMKPLANVLMENVVKAHDPNLKKEDEIPATGFSDRDIAWMRAQADKSGIGRWTHKEIDEVEYWRNRRLERPNTENMEAAL